MKGLFSILIAVSAASLASCGETDPPPPGGPQPPQVALTIAPLAYVDVSDIAYTIEVRNRSGGTVWRQERLRATSYGDGRGLTYIGPCDASTGENPNTVLLVLNDLYGAGGAVIAPDTYRNPTQPTPLSASFTCRENADTLVELNLTILRDAQQGFFDVAVQLDDIFCSAKMDCGTSGDRNMLVHDVSNGERVPTAVFAIACTGGPGADTYLWLDPIVVTCGAQSFTLDPAAGPGNHYSSSVAPPAPLAQVATTHGVEQLAQGGVSLGKLYFTLSLGLDVEAITEDCTFTAAATASDGPFSTPYTTPARTTYPVMRWQVDLVDAATDDLACGVHPIDDPNAPEGTGVFTDYTGFDAPEVFDHLVRRDPGAPGASLVEARGDGGGGAQSGRVAGVVYGDTNANGARDAGELGVAGVRVAVLDGATELGAAVTGTNGSFTIAGLGAGTWGVAVDAQSVRDAGWVRAVGAPATVVVAAAQTSTLPAIGLEPPATVTGLVFEDLDQDGAVDAGEDGVAAVTVELLTAGGLSVETTSTDGLGRYTFEVDGGASWQVAVDAGQAALLAYDGLTGPSPVAVPTVNAGASGGVDFGARPRGAIAGEVFVDADLDGVRDAGEATAEGVVVVLRTDAGVAVSSDISDADGHYAFANVGAGTWQLWVDTGDAGFVALYADLTTDNPLEVIQVEGADTVAPPVGLEPLGRIRGTVFADADASGTFEAGELGVPGVLVTATLGGTTRTATTDGSGRFVFEVPAGTWALGVDLGQSALSDYVATSTPLPLSVVATAGSDSAAELGVLEPAEVTGHVFVDGEVDRVWDGGEVVLAGVAVELVEATTLEVLRDTSDAGGVFALLVPPGSWQVRLAAGQVVLAGYDGPFFLGGVDTFDLAPGDYLEVDVAVEVAP